MASFKKKTKTSQDIPTAALPDIIFILLFFFMVVTKPREQTVKVQNELPEISQIQKMESQSSSIVIYIGPPLDNRFGDLPVIQIDNKFTTPGEIDKFIRQKKDEMGNLAEDIKIVLKIDKEAKMGIITDVQQALRKINARDIVYSALEGSGIE